jgi:hypothetical protein
MFQSLAHIGSNFLMILSHFTNKKFIFNPEKFYPLTRNHNKPYGLWLSDESDHGWRTWCRSEKYRLTRLRCHSKFNCDTSNWLVLRSSSEIKSFTETYQSSDNDYYSIDWMRVQKEFKGILITPYQWQCRLNQKSRWYYSWDCASACVWDLTTITQIKRKVKLHTT